MVKQMTKNVNLFMNFANMVVRWQECKTIIMKEIYKQPNEHWASKETKRSPYDDAKTSAKKRAEWEKAQLKAGKKQVFFLHPTVLRTLIIKYQ